ncbi:MAG: helix-hairpin-helix domain-containing protein [Sedimentisphaerales bacterium]|jgi:competence ComEA-like helix-hairpin-helix protein|nr:helix-hairpin-helix domain-containing protein [Sedimentisphaerales bacterium]
MNFEGFSGKPEKGEYDIESMAFVVCVVLCVLLSSVFVGSFFCVADEDNGVFLESRVNPNEASVPSLVRLPGIGRSRAESIVSYRDDLGAANTEGRAFRSCEDLEKVKGIGPKTAEGMCEWLKFY